MPEKAVTSLFGWSKEEAAAALAAAKQAGTLTSVSVEGQKGEWLAVATLGGQ